LTTIDPNILVFSLFESLPSMIEQLKGVYRQETQDPKIVYQHQTGFDYESTQMSLYRLEIQSRWTRTTATFLPPGFYQTHLKINSCPVYES
jgi:hypothetical protein